MRKFKLWKYDNSSFFDLSDGSIKVEELSGLGHTFDLVVSKGGDSEYVSDYNLKYDDISFTIYFGIDSNAYNDFKRLMRFITDNSRNPLILQYEVDDDIKLAEVWLKNAPKTQKNDYNVLSSQFIFQRVSAWYQPILVQFSLSNIQSDLAFPLAFPIHFVEVTGAGNKVDVENTFIEDLPINFELINIRYCDITLKLTEEIEESGHIVVKTVSQIKFRLPMPNQSTSPGAYIDGGIIDSEKKKVKWHYVDSGADERYVNGYNDINHLYDSFMLVPTGNYKLEAIIDSIDSSSVDTGYILASYKKKVLD